MVVDDGFEYARGAFMTAYSSRKDAATWTDVYTRPLH